VRGQRTQPKPPGQKVASEPNLAEYGAVPPGTGASTAAAARVGPIKPQGLLAAVVGGSAMDILIVTAEFSPLARASDAADAVASLAKALRQLGHDVTVAMPRFSDAERVGLMFARRLTPLSLPAGGEVTVYDGQLPSGVRMALFDAPALFDRKGVYGEDDKPFSDNAKRFGLLSQAAVALLRQRESQGGAFDLLHLHDWPAALVPLVLRRAPGPDVPTVLTIHDVRRQGVFGARDLDSLGLGRDVYADEGVKLNSRVNVLKGGVLAADAVTTVSPAYAREMCSEAVAGPLAMILSGLVRPVVGIANGIDYATNNPATDPLIVSRFDAEDASNKGRSKTALIRELGLELELSQPLLAVHQRERLRSARCSLAEHPEEPSNRGGWREASIAGGGGVEARCRHGQAPGPGSTHSGHG